MAHHPDLDPDLYLALEWRDGKTPVSTRHDDAYFASDDGLAESRHVFLAGCGLPDAWRGREVFVVGETGFGTGLNFLALWDLWRQAPSRPGMLHFLSVEAYPMSREQLARAMAPWQELRPLADELLAAWPEPHPGFHRLFLAEGRIALTLLVGQASDVLRELEAEVDAWFLDGFAPARNPDMWSPAVLGEVGRLARLGATLATSTTANTVRQELETAGFDIAAEPGFAGRREMTVGRRRGGQGGEGKRASRIDPWLVGPPKVRRDEGITIVGAGIAGAATAHAFSRRGISARIVERRGEIAAEASGNPLALVMPRLDAGGGLDSQIATACWRFAMAEIADDFERRGVLLPAASTRDTERDEKLLARRILSDGTLRSVTSGQASKIAGIPIAAGLFAPTAGLLRPADLCRRLIGATQIVLNATAEETSGELTVLATGGGTQAFPQVSWLPLQPVRGQVTLMPSTEASRRLAVTVARGGYLSPATDGFHVLGATHDNHGFDAETWPQPVLAEDNRRNLGFLPSPMRGLFDGVDPMTAEGRASVRITLPDRRPVVGPIVDDDRFRMDFTELRHGRRLRNPQEPQYHPGLFVLTGLGSHGFSTALLAAELLVSQMLGEPWPIERRLADALHPTRFLVKEMRREG
ncbi:MAG: bifunctional tRNA (5-methylaminomethyl-2-thiouridine)(34)-methyltransferase MnmD/FAD-dependent 5-carboxymethylaminomethyl-2-thiouridine(34) oxidoreductase MnmC [Rhodospirillaceae bacterium]|nr:bifunctional tRNA (5-methylaminomethyl-2-thiouridine)(34)-methyltransferase MnmD/FAD-dependent 5-carboxymethylaminomethyl-2-thiouridine(34) oxidoreductase MnmC [Rhodospirillaceae bacterium]